MRTSVNICETERLILRHMQTDDAAFILALLNELSFLENIGDKQVRTLEDARQYIVTGPQTSYATNGFGLYLVELKGTYEAIGMCGLIQREGLDAPDIGYAFLPQFWSRGYAIEAASAVMTLAQETFGLQRVVAITSLNNDASIRVLNKLGLKFEKMIRLPGADQESRLFVPEIR